MTNRIGTFDFLALDGAPAPIEQGVQLVSRAGVDGQAMWRTGRRGPVFRLRSQCDAYNRAHAAALMASYTALAGTHQSVLIQGGVTWTGGPIVVAVKAVTPVSIRALIRGVGGFFPPSYGFVEADWDLFFVDLS